MPIVAEKGLDWPPGAKKILQDLCSKAGQEDARVRVGKAMPGGPASKGLEKAQLRAGSSCLHFHLQLDGNDTRRSYDISVPPTQKMIRRFNKALGELQSPGKPAASSAQTAENIVRRFAGEQVPENVWLPALELVASLGMATNLEERRVELQLQDLNGLIEQAYLDKFIAVLLKYRILTKAEEQEEGANRFQVDTELCGAVLLEAKTLAQVPTVMPIAEVATTEDVAPIIEVPTKPMSNDEFLKTVFDQYGTNKVFTSTSILPLWQSSGLNKDMPSLSSLLHHRTKNGTIIDLPTTKGAAKPRMFNPAHPTVKNWLGHSTGSPIQSKKESPVSATEEQLRRIQGEINECAKQISQAEIKRKGLAEQLEELSATIEDLKRRSASLTNHFNELTNKLENERRELAVDRARQAANAMGMSLSDFVKLLTTPHE